MIYLEILIKSILSHLFHEIFGLDVDRCREFGGWCWHWTAADDDISNSILVKFNRQGTVAGYAW